MRDTRQLVLQYRVEVIVLSFKLENLGAKNIGKKNRGVSENIQKLKNRSLQV